VLIRGAPGSGPALPELHRRLRWVIVLVITAFAALIGRLWQLQVVRGHQYYESTLRNVVDRMDLPSIRGKILDRDGVPLADNRPAYNVYALREFDAFAEDQLTRLLGLSDEELEGLQARLERGRARDPRGAVLILDDVSGERAGLIAQASYRLYGIDVRSEPHRTYPRGVMAAQVLGYMNQLTPDEARSKKADGYDEADLIGRAGLERVWENYLRGKKGWEKYVRNARGERVEGPEAERLIEGEAIVAPKAGHNLVLTIDADLQAIAEEAIGHHPAGAVAVVEVRTGKIRALVSKPSYDPNIMSGHLTAAQQALLDSDPRKPYLDKTLQVHYPPGSTYKFVPVVAALEDGTIQETDTHFCPGYYQIGRRTMRCTSSHEKVDLLGAIQHSCNVYFWKLSEEVGIDRMAEVARDFGFAEPTGLGLNGDLRGRVPTREWYEQQGGFKIGYTANAAVGQGDVEVTVLQLAMAYGAIANGGTLYVPQLVERVETAGGEVVMDLQPKVDHEVEVSPGTLAIIRLGMWMVVNELGGTVHDHGRSEVVEYAGKTGTAQVRNKTRDAEEFEGWHPHRDHAWFAGYAPAADPEIAIVVLLEHGGSGGKDAGPVAREIVEGYLRIVKPGALRPAAAGDAP
jgi:penicillin-binding protein 2